MAIVALFHGGPLDGKFYALKHFTNWHRVAIAPDPPPNYYAASEAIPAFEAVAYGVGEYTFIDKGPDNVYHYAAYHERHDIT